MLVIEYVPFSFQIIGKAESNFLYVANSNTPGVNQNDTLCHKSEGFMTLLLTFSPG